MPITLTDLEYISSSHATIKDKIAIFRSQLEKVIWVLTIHAVPFEFCDSCVCVQCKDLRQMLSPAN